MRSKAGQSKRNAAAGSSSEPIPPTNGGPLSHRNERVPDDRSPHASRTHPSRRAAAGASLSEKRLKFRHWLNTFTILGLIALRSSPLSFFAPRARIGTFKDESAGFALERNWIFFDYDDEAVNFVHIVSTTRDKPSFPF